MFNFTNLAYAYASPQAQSGQEAAGNPLIGFLPIILIFGVFYFLLIRPQKKQQKERMEMIKNLKRNDEVITNGGIHGTIVDLKENTFVLRIANDTKIEIQKSYILALRKKN